MWSDRWPRSIPAAGLAVGAVGALVLSALGCQGKTPEAGPRPYDGAWTLSRQYWHKGGEPDPPSPDIAIKYRFDSATRQCQVRWETFGQPDSPREKFHQVFSAVEVRPGVLRMGDPNVGFREYDYRVEGDELVLEFVSSTIAQDAAAPVPPPPVIEVRMEEEKEVRAEVRPEPRSGPPRVMVLTRGP